MWKDYKIWNLEWLKRCCIYDILVNIHLERLVLNKVVQESMCQHGVVPCPQQTKITHLPYSHLCLLHGSRTNINLLLSCFLCAAELEHTMFYLPPRWQCPAKFIADISLLAQNWLWHAEQDRPANTLANVGGLGLHKTYTSGWERSTPRSCLYWLLID